MCMDMCMDKSNARARTGVAEQCELLDKLARYATALDEVLAADSRVEHDRKLVRLP